MRLAPAHNSARHPGVSSRRSKCVRFATFFLLLCLCMGMYAWEKMRNAETATADVLYIYLYTRYTLQAVLDVAVATSGRGLYRRERHMRDGYINAEDMSLRRPSDCNDHVTPVHCITSMSCVFPSLMYTALRYAAFFRDLLAIYFYRHPPSTEHRCLEYSYRSTLT